MTHRKVEYISCMSIQELKAELNEFFKNNIDPGWHLVSINEGDNRSHTAWLELDDDE